MATKHVVAEGDCCSSLAAKNGFADYHGIYDDAGNSALRTKRKNANTLVVGDEIQIPDKDAKTIKKPAGAAHKFVAKVTKVRLRLQVRDSEDKPCEGKPFTLLVGAMPAKGGGSMAGGFVEMDVDPQITTGVLTIVLGKAAAPAPAPAPAKLPEPAPYPPALDTATFKDVDDVAYVGHDADPHKVEWILQIGALPSHNEVVGAQARLRNLGFVCRGKDGDAGDPETKAAVKAFQKHIKAAETGLAKDVQDPLRDRHDKKS
jgi:hypothetical protein